MAEGEALGLVQPQRSVPPDRGVSTAYDKEKQVRRMLIAIALVIGLMVIATTALAGIDTSPTFQPTGTGVVLAKGVIINP